MVHALRKSQRREIVGHGFDALMADGGWLVAGDRRASFGERKRSLRLSLLSSPHHEL